MRRTHSQRGQASAELIAIVPLLVVGALALAQAVVAGWALLAAGESARVAARAAHVGGDAERAARRALPALLDGVEVDVDGSVVEVRVRAPAVLPGVDGIPVRSFASLDPQGAE